MKQCERYGQHLRQAVSSRQLRLYTLRMPPVPTIRSPWANRSLHYCLVVIFLTGIGHVAAQEIPLRDAWKTNAFASEIWEINGTNGRNNPLRRQLAEPFDGDEVFVRYRIRYPGESLDTPPEDEGEFFVLWLDSVEGNDNSAHSSNVPNIGLHVDESRNRFMVRFSTGTQKFTAEVTGDTEQLLVARLWKSAPGKDKIYDQLDLWVDPAPEEQTKPHASVASPKGISTVQWVGFSTGGKTEVEDRIIVRDLALATTWHRIMGLRSPPAPAVTRPRIRTVDFKEHVLPILTSRCFGCHRGEEAKIRLDLHDEVLNRTRPFHAADSQLIREVTSGRMPPEDEPQLTLEEKQTLATWVDEGVVWDEQTLPASVLTSNHWAFQPVVRPNVPSIKRRGWIRTPVDSFIGRQHEELGLEPAAEAPDSVLQRRYTLGLLGLPAKQKRRSIDSLLSDPAFGVRWARHWLDVARWAESNGHQHNRFRPTAWRYRDWVVKAFNSNMPYDEFLRAQIAGDELQPVDDAPDSRLTATGFLAAARYSGNELDKRIQRNDILVDVVNTTASAFLGLTLECAQCHSHKFDPITIRDYYRLQACFAGGQPANVCLTESEVVAAPLAGERKRIFDQTYDRLVRVRERRGLPNAELVTPTAVVSGISSRDKPRFNELQQTLKTVPQTWAFYAPASARRRRTILPHEMRWPLPDAPQRSEDIVCRLLLRGDVNVPGPQLAPGWPGVFGESHLGPHPRAELADWLTSPAHPLTARVWVNRIWQWHFGHGLVATAADFGTQGAPPSHPRLLDYLASELIEQNWNTGHIHRLILNSATFRQSSQYSETNAGIDPDNRSLWRWTPRRLEAEAIRDCILAVSGQLIHTQGGPSDSSTGTSVRRSLYLRQHRERLPEQQTLFDSSGAVVSCARRRVSTTPLQPLWQMNSQFVNTAATKMARRFENVDAAFKACLGRAPSAEESTLLGKHTNKHGVASTMLVLINANEFIYIP